MKLPNGILLPPHPLSPTSLDFLFLNVFIDYSEYCNIIIDGGEKNMYITILLYHAVTRNPWGLREDFVVAGNFYSHL